MDTKKFTLLVVLLLSLSWVKSPAQGWSVPEEAKSKVSSFLFTKETIDKGKGIYQKNCQSCHGIPGQNNPAKISPDPGDPAAARYQSQKDGEIFWKITNGKVPMPQFQNILSEEERWDVISYVRSFNPKYVQPAPETRAGFKGRMLKVRMDYLAEKKKVRVIVSEMLPDKHVVPAAGSEIILSAKRYFGEMQIGDPKTTGKAGIVLFDAPADLPGDKEGNLELTARVNDPTGNSGDARISAALKIGKPNNVPGLLETRAMWSTRDKAPLWVIATYASAVLLAWGFIFYILISLRKIKKLNA